MNRKIYKEFQWIEKNTEILINKKKIQRVTMNRKIYKELEWIEKYTKSSNE